MKNQNHTGLKNFNSKINFKQDIHIENMPLKKKRFLCYIQFLNKCHLQISRIFEAWYFAMNPPAGKIILYKSKQESSTNDF